LESSHTNGSASRASQAIGTATRVAMVSDRVSARRLGTSSPKMSVMKVIRLTARVVPSWLAYAKPGMSAPTHAAMASPMASPPR